MAQRPINASKDYLRYELDRNDFDFIVKTCARAQDELQVDLDFSVCLPDCAFTDQNTLQKLQKGDCFGGVLAYAICTNGDVKACQCDTQTYGNILTDSFKSIYENMVAWRDGSLVPEDCRTCERLSTCRGGCRVESFANKQDYRGLPTFANTDNVPDISDDTNNIQDLTYSKFKITDETIFLKDLDCYRISVGIVPTHLSIEFSEWLMNHNTFTFNELATDCELNHEEINLVLNLLYSNGVITVINNE